MAKLKRSLGFSVIEFLIVIAIIGVLAAFGIPRFKAVVEKTKASEAFNYLAALRSAQERYHSQKGTYADDVKKLNLQQSPPEYFLVGTVTADENRWSLALTRSESTKYGPYTVVYTDEGFDSFRSTIPSEVNPRGN